MAGDPLILECRATRTRQGKANLLVRYSFRFSQNEKIVYEGDQTAYWMNVTAAQQSPALTETG